MFKKEWVRETARDLIALGSVPFFILVLVRVWLLNKPEFFMQFIISGGLFLILFIILKPNIYAGLGAIALIFTSLYYQDIKYTSFAIPVYILLVASLFYLKYDKKKIIFGVLGGLIISGIISFLKI